MKKHIITLTLIIITVVLTSCNQSSIPKQIDKKESSTSTTTDILVDTPEPSSSNNTVENELLYPSTTGIVITIPKEINDIIIISETDNGVEINQKCTAECCDNRQRIISVSATSKTNLTREEATTDTFYLGENSNSYFFFWPAIDFAHSQEEYIQQFKENSDYIKELITNITFIDPV